MNKSFYNGPRILISEDFIKIKDRNLRLEYKDILLVAVRKTRIDKWWLLYILAGIILCLTILYLFFLTIKGITNDSGILAGGNYHRNRFITVLVFFFIGSPVFIIGKIKKYFKKHLMLIINWEHGEFRMKISSMGISEDELKNYFTVK